MTTSAKAVAELIGLRVSLVSSRVLFFIESLIWLHLSL
jgi:hypothetical protein